MRKNVSALRPSNAISTRGFIGVFTALIIIFLLIPLFLNNFYAHIALQVSFLILLLSTIYTLSITRSLLIVSLALTLCFLLFNVLSVVHNSIGLMIIAYAFDCIFLGMAIVCLGRVVFREEAIDTNLLFATLTIYMLAGILWSKLFFIIACLLPNSFHGIFNVNIATHDLTEIYTTQFDLLYFSFTTLSTLGVDDITPLRHLAKSLTVLEAMFGQLFVAIIVAKIVSVWHPRLSKTTLSND